MSAAPLHIEDLDRSDRVKWHVRSSCHGSVEGADEASLSSVVEAAEKFSDTLNNSLGAFLEKELAQIDAVKTVRISCRVQNGRPVTHVWTSLSDDSREIRYRVYEVEERLMARFHDELFDFHVHPEGDDLPTGAVSVYSSTD